MRTSLNEISEAEAYLLGRKPAPEQLLYEAKLLVSPARAVNFKIQKLIYKTVKLLGRRRLKAELSAVQHELMTNPSKEAFQKQIEEIFREEKP